MAVKGTWGIGNFRIPDFGITENLFGAKPTAKPSTFYNPPAASKASNTITYRPTSASVLGASSSRTPSSLAGATVQASYQPSTGGQSAGGGGGGGSYSAPQESGGGQDYGDYLNELRSAYGGVRSSLEGMLPTYDADFNNFKTQSQDFVNQAKGTLETQTQDLGRRYGDSLKSLLQSDKDIRGRTNSTFSGLGALDSSAYRDELNKQDQYLLDSQGKLDFQKNKDITDAQTMFANYEKEQLGKINSYQNEINRAKQSIQSAIANSRLDEAESIIGYTNQLRQEQQNIQNQMQQYQMQLAQLQAQGVDVIGNLKKINGVDFNNQFGQNLASRYNTVTGRYQMPTQAPTGAGYIGSSKADEERRLLGYV